MQGLSGWGGGERGWPEGGWGGFQPANNHVPQPKPNDAHDEVVQLGGGVE